MLSLKSKKRNGFTLVELLVVIGIIAVLIGMLLPALSRVQQQSKWLKCQSNLRTIGQYLYMYGNQWKGYCYPPGLGAGTRPYNNTWPQHVFGVWNPPVMLCPADAELNSMVVDPAGNVVFPGEPQWEHSYILNDHIFEHGMKFGTRPPNGVSNADVVLMGEKTTTEPDYYMNETSPGLSDFVTGKVELYRHGFRLGSNYLYMDGHVGTFKRIGQFKHAADPWDFTDDKDVPSAK